MKKSYFYDGMYFTRKELEDYFKQGEEQNRKNPDERLIKTLKMIEGKDVLDVGCAGGGLALQIAHRSFNVHAIDILEESIKIAKEFSNRPNITYEVRDVLKQTFPPDSFDCITFLETIEHVENPAVYLREFYRILRPSGHIVLSTPNATSLKNMFYALSYRKKEKRLKVVKEISSELKKTGTQLEHIYNWDFPTLVRLLDRCGFELVDHTFARSGPIVVPFFTRKIVIIKPHSKILDNFESLKTTHIMKAQKRPN